MGKVFVVGIGPGKKENMTFEALNAIQNADVLCGYTVYVDLIKDLFHGGEVYATGMLQEIERCKWAVDKAQAGKSVALVCSGDAGVYGMAGPVLEIAKSFNDVEVKIISGVTACNSGGALLGAPLMNDYCVISLSDRLTPWEKIEKRLKHAAQGDFVICLYNPASKLRKDHLKKACDIILQVRKPETICGCAFNIRRAGEHKLITTLEDLRETEVDMFTTVFIGSDDTTQIGEYMVTPRGYNIK